MNYEVIEYGKDEAKFLTHLGLAMRKPEPKTLLEGKPYTNAASTDIRKTFAKLGWVPPSEVK